MTNLDQIQKSQAGLFAGVAAYVMWGFFPIYFKITAEVPPLEILAYRILWSVPFGFLIIVFRKQIPDVVKALKSPKTLLLLALAAMLIAMNWGIYIWTVQNDQIFQASLGYYINPLMFVLIGVAFLEERLRKLQIFAVLLATIGVVILTIIGGQFPWIAIILATSFTVYGVIRKQLDIGAMPGLFLETLILFIPATAYLIWLHMHGQMTFLNASTKLDLLLILAGPLTVLPLLAFAFATRRLKLSTIGFLQFIAPSLQFLIGLYYGEEFTSAYLLCFSFIWGAALLFIIDAVRKRPTQKI
ncbi:MAG: protein RarD [Robiginitomaculum sp.]|nr:MAG: protein RarD [Robiginitomaculum sp.]